jgi:hypothetical protein
VLYVSDRIPLTIVDDRGVHATRNDLAGVGQNVYVEILHEPGVPLAQAFFTSVFAHLASDDCAAGLSEGSGFGDLQQLLGTSVHQPYSSLVVYHHDAILDDVHEGVRTELLEKEIQRIDGFEGLLTEDAVLIHLLALLGVAVEIRDSSNLKWMETV